MSKGFLAEDDRNFSMFDKIAYTGAVAGVIPTTGLSGDDLIANYMEGDLSLAGIKKREPFEVRSILEIPVSQTTWEPSWTDGSPNMSPMTARIRMHEPSVVSSDWEVPSQIPLPKEPGRFMNSSGKRMN